MGLTMSKSDWLLVAKFVVGVLIIISILPIASRISDIVNEPARAAKERIAEQDEKKRNDESNRAFRQRVKEASAARAEYEREVRDRATRVSNDAQVNYYRAIVAEDPSVRVMRRYDNGFMSTDDGPAKCLVITPAYSLLVKTLGPPKTIRKTHHILQANWDVIKAQYYTDRSGRPLRLRYVTVSSEEWVAPSASNYWKSGMKKRNPDLDY